MIKERHVRMKSVNNQLLSGQGNSRANFTKR